MTKSIPRKKSLVEKIIWVLVNYLKTQCILMLVVSLVVWLILTVLHVRFALLLALMTGTLSVIPMLGFLVAAIIASVVATVDGSVFLVGAHPIVEGLVILVLYLMLNQLVDLLLAPYLVGKLTRIHPLIIFVAVIVGTMLFGISGTILAIPIILIGKTIWDHYQEK